MIADTMRKRGSDRSPAASVDDDVAGPTIAKAVEGNGLRESKLKRTIYALPLLGLCFVAGWVLNVEPAVEWAKSLREIGTFDLPSGSSMPLLNTFYHLPALDDFLSVANTFFLPSVYNADPASRQQLLSFLTDGAVFLTIWIFESARHANKRTPLQWPNLFTALGQILGIGLVSTLYCFLHYIFSPIDNNNFSPTPADDQRLTRTRRISYASLPAVLLAYLVPFYMMLVWPDLPARQAVLFVWQLHPLWLAGVLWVLSSFVFKGTTTPAMDKGDRTQQEDLLTVRVLYVGTAGVLGAGVWWWSLAVYGFREVFVPAGLPVSMAGDLTGYTGLFLRWDQVFGAGAHLVWLAYLFGDLKAAGMLREGWFRVVGLGLLSVLVVGPGATVGLGWLFREYILATRRHRDASTPESVGRLHGTVI